MRQKKYQGQLLVANPKNPRDGLYGSVILLLSHTDQISVGVQINHRMKEINLADVANGIGIWYEGADPLYHGGNVGTGKVHVIHSLDWQGLSTTKINKELGVTNDISILSAISNGEGPEYFRACAGMWMWEGNILDHQLDPKKSDTVLHRWEIAPSTMENVFEEEEDNQWYSVLENSARMQVNSWF
jgi:hypothetical protein